jgi:hypothetical protein
MHDIVLKLFEIPALWFEILIPLSCVPGLLWLSIKNKRCPASIRIIPLLSAIAAGMQFLIEGYRWQIIPTGIVVAVLLSISILPFWYTVGYHRGLLTVGWGLCFATIMSEIIFPAIATPKPTGRFAIGTTILHLIDGSRRETLDPSFHGARELMIQIWYPADRSIKPLSVNTILQRAEERLGSRGDTSITGSAVSAARQRYPLLIFSPSWHGQRNQNDFQVAELASHGFVVVGIDHTFSSAVTVFPDGRIARAQLTNFVDLSSDSAFQASFRHNEDVLRVRVQDVEFVVSELERLNRQGSGSKLSERLDFHRLGIFGYSFGGAVAAQACWLDHRFRAGLDMDGTLFGGVADEGIEQPFAFFVERTQSPALDSSKSREPEKRRYAWINERDFSEQQNSMKKYGGYWLGIKGTGHVNFTGPPIYPTIGYYLDGAGTINPDRAMRIINAYTLAFFEKHLNHQPEPILNGPSPSFPEVNFAWALPPLRELIVDMSTNRSVKSSTR